MVGRVSNLSRTSGPRVLVLGPTRTGRTSCYSHRRVGLSSGRGSVHPGREEDGDVNPESSPSGPEWSKRSTVPEEPEAV